MQLVTHFIVLFCKEYIKDISNNAWHMNKELMCCWFFFKISNESRRLLSSHWPSALLVYHTVTDNNNNNRTLNWTMKIYHYILQVVSKAVNIKFYSWNIVRSSRPRIHNRDTGKIQWKLTLKTLMFRPRNTAVMECRACAVSTSCRC